MTVIPAVVPADPAPASTEASSQPPAKPGFDRALARASHKDDAKPDDQAAAKPDSKPRAKDADSAKPKAKTGADAGDDTDATPPKEVATLGDATVAALVAALSGDAAPTAPSTDASASDTDAKAADSATSQPGITNVFAAAVAALTEADAKTATPSEPASEKGLTGPSGTQVGEAKGERKDFVQTVPGAATDKGRAIDVPPIRPTGDDANTNANGGAGAFTRTTVPAATNASATAVAHAADPSPVHGTAPAAVTRNNGPQAVTGSTPSIAPAPAATTARVDAPVATSETTATAPAPPPPPAEQLVAVMRPLQRTADGSYRVRIELRPPELGRVDMRIEVKDGVVHASIHAEHAETAELVRNALDDLRARLESEGVRAGSLEVNDGRANDTRRDQPRQQNSTDEPELVTAPALMTTRPLHQSDALLDVRI